MASRDYLNYKLNVVRGEIPKLKKKLSGIYAAVTAMDQELDSLNTRLDTCLSTFDTYENTLVREYDRKIKKLEEELEKALKSGAVLATSDQVNEVVLGKARTIAIFDAILSAITSWSTHGDQASDVEAASQSVVFPSVYNRVMSGDDPAYLLDDVPVTAEIVVQRGREFVKWIRSECETHITTPGAWEQFAPKVQEWWVRDALPLIYGEADPDWEDDRPFSLEEIDVWRNNPADRMMAFPKIHDAMDLLQKHRSEIYDSTRIREFNQHTAQTRLS